MSVKKLKQFDDHIGDTFEGFEAPYNPKAWNRIESKLGGGSSFAGGLKIASVVAVIALGGAAAFYFSSSDEIPAEVQETIVAEIPESKPLPNETSKEIASLAEAASSIVQEEAADPAPIESTPSPTTTAASVSATPPIEPDVEEQLNVVLSKNQACLGEVVEFSLDTDRDVVWEFGDGKSQFGKSVRHRYSAAGEYEATASILGENDETLKMIKSSKLKVNKLPNPEFEMEGCDDAGALITFYSLQPSSKNFWKLGNGQVIEGTQVEHRYAKRGFHKATHIVENEFGCIDSSVQRVKICRAFNLLAPPQFDPTAGTWFPIGLIMSNLEFDLKIIDPEGAVAFTSTDTENKWDGAEANPGQVYGWIATVKDTNGQKSEYGGQIEIVGNE
jgi:hypothetical protein